MSFPRFHCHSRASGNLAKAPPARDPRLRGDDSKVAVMEKYTGMVY